MNVLELVKLFLELLKSLPDSATLWSLIALAFGYEVIRRRASAAARDGRGADRSSIQYPPLRFSVDRTMRSILKKEYNDQLFRDKYGYSLDAERRRLLWPIVSAPNSPMSWSTTKEARPYIRVRAGHLSIEYTLWDKVGYHAKTAFGFILFCLGGIGAMALGTYTKFSAGGIIAAVLTCVLLCGMSFALVWSTFGLAKAMQLERWLTEDDDQHARSGNSTSHSSRRFLTARS